MDIIVENDEEEGKELETGKLKEENGGEKLKKENHINNALKEGCVEEKGENIEQEINSEQNDHQEEVEFQNKEVLEE